MPPKAKDSASKKPPPPIIRPPISDSSLMFTPEDVVEGFEERIETGINWTISGQTLRHHRKLCERDDIPTVTFSEALQEKIKHSILDGFLNENSGLTLEQQWEVNLPITLWDNEHFANEEGKICFQSANSITDNLFKLIKNSVKHNDREVMKKELKLVSTLRINGAKMTDIDEELEEFKKLVTLNLSGNFIKTFDPSFLHSELKNLELQANRISEVDKLVEFLPPGLLYLGLSRNFLNSDSIAELSRLSHNIMVIDLSENDIYNLEPLLNALGTLESLTSLSLTGNPCSMCVAYGCTTLMRIPSLQWLDSREVLATDRPVEPFEPHPNDLRSGYFFFQVFRVISAPQPPKPEKGAQTAFYIELELPLLDSIRRKFLMFGANEDLVEILPPPEDEEWPPSKTSSVLVNSQTVVGESSPHPSDIYNQLVPKNEREIHHYTTFESNRVQWNKIMTFQDPIVRIFCPDLVALRNTFRTIVTVRLIYSVSMPSKQSKDKKSAHLMKIPAEQTVTLASIKCSLKYPDWTQTSQHFHWDDTLGSDEAIHWGDGDLSVIQYSIAPQKQTKGKPDADLSASRQVPPENLTCHFGFGIDAIRM